MRGDNTKHGSHKTAGSKLNLPGIKKRKRGEKQVRGLKVVNLTATNSWSSTLLGLFGFRASICVPWRLRRQFAALCCRSSLINVNSKMSRAGRACLCVCLQSPASISLRQCHLCYSTPPTPVSLLMMEIAEVINRLDIL